MYVNSETTYRSTLSFALQIFYFDHECDCGSSFCVAWMRMTFVAVPFP